MHTPKDLKTLSSGLEAVSSSNPCLFIGVQSADYWSSTTNSGDQTIAYVVYYYPNHQGIISTDYNNNPHYVWPVRSGQ
ncbi:MAG: DUF1566 domain-containing protein [Deltaproteobacteria bacterium]|nr:DUF1566 domain-containing protein [Deltaproteobacteria bacterium]